MTNYECHYSIQKLQQKSVRYFDSYQQCCFRPMPMFYWKYKAFLCSYSVGMVISNYSNCDELCEDGRSLDVQSFLTNLEGLSIIASITEEPHKSLPICSTPSKGHPQMVVNTTLLPIVHGAHFNWCVAFIVIAKGANKSPEIYKKPLEGCTQVISNIARSFVLCIICLDEWSAIERMYSKVVESPAICGAPLERYTQPIVNIGASVVVHNMHSQ